MNVDKIREVENNINVSLHLFTSTFHYSINTHLLVKKHSKFNLIMLPNKKYINTN